MNKQNNYGTATAKLFVFIDDERHPSHVDWFQPLLTNNKHSAWLKSYNPTNAISNNNQEAVVIIRTFFDFVHWIDTQKSKKNFDWNNVIFSFDHDLQDWHQQVWLKTNQTEASASLEKNSIESLIVQYGINYPYGEHPDKIELTGASCLKYLLDNVENINLDNIDLHTKNSIAINSMRNIANRYNFKF